MKQLFLFVVAAVVLAACSDDKPEQDLTIAPVKNATTDNAINSSVTSNQNLQQMPAEAITGMPQTQTTIPQSVTSATTGAGMNPEHGKPGHKCEIAVGAPLNPVPAKAAAAPTTITQPTTVPAIAPAKTVTAKGMNPPHGEAGHRCDISVGAPLTSAPTTATKPLTTTGATTITPVAAPVQNSSIVPALQNTSISTTPKATTAFTGKINPAHGQPGHDCKVAVGQPLP